MKGWEPELRGLYSSYGLFTYLWTSYYALSLLTYQMEIMKVSFS